MLDQVYALCVHAQIAELQKSPGFSVSYDCWTSGSNIHSMLALLIHFLDDAFRPQSILVDLIELKKSHTSQYLAVSIMKRLSLAASDHQVLYGSISDNASNVVRAAELILNNFGIDNDLNGIAETQSEDTEFFEFGLLRDLTQDECSAAGAMEEPDQSLHTCVNHTLELAIGDLKKYNSRLNTAIERAQSLVVAIKDSRHRQKTVYDILKTTNGNVKNLSRDVCTRWRSLYLMLETLIPAYPAIIFAICNNEISIETVNFSLPTESDIRLLSALRDTLNPLAQASEALEGNKYLTLPHLPIIVRAIIQDLDRMADVNLAQELKSFVVKRVMKYVGNPTSFAMLAAAVHPLYSMYLDELFLYGDIDGYGSTSTEMGVSLQSKCMAKVVDW